MHNYFLTQHDQITTKHAILYLNDCYSALFLMNTCILYSILMTTCSSVLGLAFMPLNIFLYSKLVIPLDSGQVVPFDKIIFNIALTLFPVSIGIAIRHYKPQWVPKVMKVNQKNYSLLPKRILLCVWATSKHWAFTVFGTQTSCPSIHASLYSRYYAETWNEW